MGTASSLDFRFAPFGFPCSTFWDSFTDWERCSCMNSTPHSSEQYLLVIPLASLAAFLHPSRRHIGFQVVIPTPFFSQLGQMYLSMSLPSSSLMLTHRPWNQLSQPPSNP